jgi:hypothetical protein
MKRSLCEPISSEFRACTHHEYRSYSGVENGTRDNCFVVCEDMSKHLLKLTCT